LSNSWVGCGGDDCRFLKQGYQDFIDV